MFWAPKVEPKWHRKSLKRGFQKTAVDRATKQHKKRRNGTCINAPQPSKSVEHWKETWGICMLHLLARSPCVYFETVEKRIQNYPHN